MRNPRLAKERGKFFGLFHRGGAHENRLPRLVAFLDIFNDGAELPGPRGINQIEVILADHRLVRGDRHHAEIVGRGKLLRLGLCGTGHTGQLVVQAEVVLQRDRGEGLVLRLDLHTFFGFDSLVHALVVTTPREYATGVLIDDQDLTVLDDVVLIAFEELLGLNRVVEVADQRRIERFVQVIDAQ